MERKPKNIFVDGAIAPSFIAESIAKHRSKTGIGGHNIFLGPVRADDVNGQIVKAIEYTAYKEMALEKMHDIREAIFLKYDLTCVHVHHSLGTVKAVKFVYLFLHQQSTVVRLSMPVMKWWSILSRNCLFGVRRFLITSLINGSKMYNLEYCHPRPYRTARSGGCQL